MLAIRLEPGGELRTCEEPVPDPRPDEALVRVGAVGLCGSDRHWVVDGGTGDGVLDRPLVLGHEFAGTVESGSHRGRLVAVDPAVHCDVCEPCRSGAPNLCVRVAFAGHGRTDGALRELVAWPERNLHPLSDAIDVTDGALVEPLAVALYAVELAGGVRDATVGIVGCGPIGLLLAAVARAAGASAVIATDPLRHRLNAANEQGATTTVEATPARGEREVILGATGGRGVDIAFDASGEAAAVETAVHIARPGGEVVLVGIPPDDRTSFRASVARRKGLTLKLSRRSTPDSFQRAVAVAEAGTIDLGRLVTHRVPLRHADRAFDALVRQEGIKILVEPGGAA